MKAQIPAGQMMRRAAVAILLVLSVTGLLVAGFWDSMFTKQPLALRFLYYTNNEVRSRIAVMEISNRTDEPYEWRFHSCAKGVNHVVGVSDLLETNGELRAVSPFTGCSLYGHDTLQFGTDEYQAGEQFWVEVKHYPRTAGDLRRDKLSGWLWRHGWYRASPYVELGRRINGPVLPPDHP
jgi:hypothetical protein